MGRLSPALGRAGSVTVRPPAGRLRLPLRRRPPPRVPVYRRVLTTLGVAYVTTSPEQAVADVDVALVAFVGEIRAVAKAER